MNTRIRDLLFFLICIGSVFRWIPVLSYHPIPVLNTLGGASGFASKMMYIPLIIGMLYTFYCYFIRKDRNVLIISKKIIIFAFVYLGINTTSLILGISQFPFMDQVIQGPSDQIRNMNTIKKIVDLLGLKVADANLIMWVAALRTYKNMFFEFIWQFGGVYLIYCWYRNEPRRLMKLLTAGITAVVLLEVLNSIVEWFYLAGSPLAKRILEMITPVFHPVNLNGAGSPHLLWPGQVRGTFTEPSYFGMFCAFALPFLWYEFVHNENRKVKILYGTLSLTMAFDIFLTSSRTALGIFLVEVILLFVLGLYMRNKHLLMMVCLTVAVNIAGLGLGNFYMGHIMAPDMVKIVAFGITNTGDLNSRKAKQPKQNTQKAKQPKQNTQKAKQPKQNTQKAKQPKQKTENVQQSTLRGYFERNLLSLTDINKRSNRSRFTIALTNIRIGLDHPLLGVGRELRQPYITQYLKGQKLNGEINKWIRFQKEKGVLAQVFPNLGDYAVHFAEGGILGLISFLVIPLLLLVRLVKGVIKEKNFLYGIVLISLIGSMAVGLGDSLTILYVYWLLLGIGYALTANPDVSNKSDGQYL